MFSALAIYPSSSRPFMSSALPYFHLTFTLPFIHTHTRAHIHTHTRAHIHTHTRAHIHTHTLSLPLFPSLTLSLLVSPSLSLSLPLFPSLSLSFILSLSLSFSLQNRGIPGICRRQRFAIHGHRLAQQKGVLLNLQYIFSAIHSTRSQAVFHLCAVSMRGGGLGSSTIFKKFNEPYAPS